MIRVKIFYPDLWFCLGEGNGSPLQCSCLENPMDEGAWWAAVYGVAQSRTRLKRLSSSSSSSMMLWWLFAYGDYFHREFFKCSWTSWSFLFWLLEFESYFKRPFLLWVILCFPLGLLPFYVYICEPFLVLSMRYGSNFISMQRWPPTCAYGVYWIICLFSTDLKCHFCNIPTSSMYVDLFLDFLFFSPLMCCLFIHQHPHCFNYYNWKFCFNI